MTPELRAPSEDDIDASMAICFEAFRDLHSRHGFPRHRLLTGPQGASRKSYCWQYDSQEALP